MDIDLVYLWVDGSDPEWIKKKEAYSGNIEKYDKDATNVSRFYNNDELKYSLRSVEAYAPWINNIYIVTDNQVPSWLNLNNPKIKIVDHKELFPHEKLPLFNSTAIEAKLYAIPGLSEYFLYANDDMFFWDKVDKDFFFKDDKIICRFDKILKKGKNHKGLYGCLIRRAHELVRSRFNLSMDAYYPHHNVDAYKKTLFEDCVKEFQKEFDVTLDSRFREFTDVQRSIVSFYAIAKGLGIPMYIRKSFWERHILKRELDSRYYGINSRKIDKILKTKSKLMCLNDYRKTTNSDRSMVKEVLEQKFPNKSEFEK